MPATTKAIFNIAQLVTTEKRAGLKNLHLVNLLANAIQPLPLHLHASRSAAGKYRLAIPPLGSDALRVDFLFSKTLSKRFPASKLPKGLKATRLPAKDLERLKAFVLKQEMRREDAWQAFLKLFDTTRQFSVDARSKGVELPLSLKVGGHEQIALLARTGKLPPARGAALAKLTVIQTIEAASRSAAAPSCSSRPAAASDGWCRDALLNRVPAQVPRRPDSGVVRFATAGRPQQNGRPSLLHRLT